MFTFCPCILDPLAKISLLEKKMFTSTDFAWGKKKSKIVRNPPKQTKTPSLHYAKLIHDEM